MRCRSESNIDKMSDLWFTMSKTRTEQKLDFGHSRVIVDFSFAWTPSRYYMLWFLLRSYYM